jgi:tetratricopeptide (TPR) repeat protein
MKKLLSLLLIAVVLLSAACTQHNEKKAETPIPEAKAPQNDPSKPDPKAFMPGDPTADSSAKILFTRAATLIGLENYADGIKYINQYIEKFPNDANAYFVKGFAEDQAKNYKTALNDFAEALRRNPDHTYAMMYKGHAHLYLDQFPEAFELFTRVIKKEPNNMLAFYNRGLALSKLNKYKESIDDFGNALKIDSTYAPAYNNRGNAKYLAGDADGACKDWKTSIRLGNIASEKAYKFYCEGEKAKKTATTTPPPDPKKKK